MGSGASKKRKQEKTAKKYETEGEPEVIAASGARSKTKKKKEKDTKKNKEEIKKKERQSKKEKQTKKESKKATTKDKKNAKSKKQIQMGGQQGAQSNEYTGNPAPDLVSNISHQPDLDLEDNLEDNQFSEQETYEDMYMEPENTNERECIQDDTYDVLAADQTPQVEDSRIRRNSDYVNKEVIERHSSEFKKTKSQTLPVNMGNNGDDVKPPLPERKKPEKNNPMQGDEPDYLKPEDEGGPPIPTPRPRNDYTLQRYRQPSNQNHTSIYSENGSRDSGEYEETEYDDTGSVSPKEEKGIKAVVAIDFGTTFSGYAYSFVDSKDKIEMNKNWIGPKGSSYKAPTWVSLNANEDFNAFGYDAQNTHGDSEAKEKQLSLYKEFKLFLMKKGLDELESVLVESEFGSPIEALKIFVAALQYLKDHVLNYFRDAGKKLNARNVLWVLTVPAIWEDSQKVFMRQAGHKAGLVQDENSEQLLIALEPEAAALFCRSLKMHEFRASQGDSKVKLPQGTVYVVLDAGGGTIDITVHQVMNDHKVIMRSNGGPWGGSKVNGRFETKFKGVLGEDFVKHCQVEFPSIWIDLILEFEIAKQSDSARPDSDKPLSLNIAYGLSSTYENFTQKKLADTVNQNAESGVKMTHEGRLQFSAENVKGMFQTVVSKTIDHMRHLFEKPEVEKASIIFIVGGFGQCPYLQEEVKKHFETGRRRVLIPTDGNVCVVKGAVMFGYENMPSED